MVVDVERGGFGKIAGRFCLFSEPIIAKSKHIEAVDSIAEVEVAVPYQEVGERYGEVVHAHVIVEVLLSIIDESVEVCPCFVFVTKSTESKSGIENLVRFGVVIVHRRSGFGWAECSLIESLRGLVVLSESFIANTKEIVEIVFLSAVELAFAEVMRIFETFFEESYSLLIFLAAINSLASSTRAVWYWAGTLPSPPSHGWKIWLSSFDIARR